MNVYYNDNSPECCAWLRELAGMQLIHPGRIDERSITDVRPEDLADYIQCHFFAGIGGWPYALQLAGWPDDDEVWSASCPCQPLSCAGQRKGHADRRHLWPSLYRLIAKRRPATIFGEQVASELGREWFAGVRTDLEGLGYAVGAADLCAASVGAPHIRQRIFWVAYAKRNRGHDGRRFVPVGNGESERGEAAERGKHLLQTQGHGDAGWLADTHNQGSQGRRLAQLSECASQRATREDGDTGGVGHAVGTGCEARDLLTIPAAARPERPLQPSAWSNFDTIPCLDGKARRIESGTFPLAHGVSARVGRLRGYGNGIVPQVAAEFIQAFRESVA